MNARNLTLGMIVVLVAATAFIATFGFRDPGIERTGPAFLPRLYTGALILLGLTLALSRRPSTDAGGAPARSLVGMAIGAVYVVALPWLGFVLSTLVLAPSMLAYVGVRSPWVLILLPLGLVGFIQLFFTVLLGIEVLPGQLWQ